MSSILLSVISLILTLSLGSHAEEDFKRAICDNKATYIDSIIDFKDHRYIIINDKLFEYDYKNDFRRRGVLDYEIYYYERNDETNQEIYSTVPG